MHLALQRTNRQLQRLAYHGSADMEVFAEPPFEYPRIAPGAPFSSLRALEVHLPQSFAGSPGMTHDTEVFAETLFAFLRNFECNFEELTLSVENFCFERSLIESGKYFIMHFPTGTLMKLRTLELAGVFLNQGIPLDGESTFQEFLESRKNTLERLVLRDVALHYTGYKHNAAGHTTDKMRDRVSWPRMIEFMHNNLELKTVRLGGKLVSPLHFSWDTTDQDNISLGMPDEDKHNCVRPQIERYIVNKPAGAENPLHHWRYHTTEDCGNTYFHVPKCCQGDWSWKPLGYELEPYTGRDEYKFHPTDCQCAWCLERGVGHMVL